MCEQGKDYDAQKNSKATKLKQNKKAENTKSNSKTPQRLSLETLKTSKSHYLKTPLNTPTI